MLSYSELNSLAKDMNLKVLETESLPKNVQGLFCPSLDLIAIRKSLHEIEKRWVLAHEIGHAKDSETLAFLSYLRRTGNSGGGLQPEKTADRYAISLLCSSDQIKRAYKESEGDLRKMCSELEIPYEAGRKIIQNGILSEVVSS